MSSPARSSVALDRSPPTQDPSFPIGRRQQRRARCRDLSPPERLRDPWKPSVQPSTRRHRTLVPSLAPRRLGVPSCSSRTSVTSCPGCSYLVIRDGCSADLLVRSCSVDAVATAGDVSGIHLVGDGTARCASGSKRNKCPPNGNHSIHGSSETALTPYRRRPKSSAVVRSASLGWVRPSGEAGVNCTGRPSVVGGRVLASLESIIMIQAIVGDVMA